MYNYARSIFTKVVIAGLIISSPLQGVSASTLPHNSALAPPLASKPLAYIQETDSGVFKIIETESFLEEVLQDYRRDAEQKYFHILKKQAEDLELSRNGLKEYIKEHLEEGDFVAPPNEGFKSERIDPEVSLSDRTTIVALDGKAPKVIPTTISNVARKVSVDIKKMAVVAGLNKEELLSTNGLYTCSAIAIKAVNGEGNNEYLLAHMTPGDIQQNMSNILHFLKMKVYRHIEIFIDPSSYHHSERILIEWIKKIKKELKETRVYFVEEDRSGIRVHKSRNLGTINIKIDGISGEYMNVDTCESIPIEYSWDKRRQEKVWGQTFTDPVIGSSP